MNFIFKLFEKALETYFIEIEFYSPKSNELDDFNKKNGTDYGGDFKLYLPLFVQVKHFTQAEMIMNIITETLRNTYGINVFTLLKIDKNPVSKKRFEFIAENLNKSYEYSHKSTLDIIVHQPNNLGIYDFNKPKTTTIDIKVISVGTLSWIKQFNYNVIIKKKFNED